MIVGALAVILTGLALIAPGAHLFEYRKKIVMPADEYFVVQKIYVGWWLVGLFLPAAFFANAALAIRVRADATAFWLAVAAAALVLFQPDGFCDPDAAHQQSHQKLDHPARTLAGAAAAVGRFSRRQRRGHFFGFLRRDARGAARAKLNRSFTRRHCR